MYVVCPTALHGAAGCRDSTDILSTHRTDTSPEEHPMGNRKINREKQCLGAASKARPLADAASEKGRGKTYVEDVFERERGPPPPPGYCCSTSPGGV